MTTTSAYIKASRKGSRTCWRKNITSWMQQIKEVQYWTEIRKSTWSEYLIVDLMRKENN